MKEEPFSMVKRLTTASYSCLDIMLSCSTQYKWKIRYSKNGHTYFNTSPEALFHAESFQGLKLCGCELSSNVALASNGM